MGLFQRLFGSGAAGKKTLEPTLYTNQERGDVGRAAHRLAQLYDEAVRRAKAATEPRVRALQIKDARKRIGELQELMKEHRTLRIKNMVGCEAELKALEGGEIAGSRGRKRTKK